MRHRRNHKKQARKTGFEQKLTHDQGLALIPGGAVSAQRGIQDEIGLETRSSTKKGSPIVTGQYVSTPIRKLLQADLITLEEAAAAWTYERHHDVAYASGTNPLAALQVDGGGGPGEGVIERKAHHGLMLRKVNMRLGSECAAIAMAAVLGRPGKNIDSSYTAIGADLLPFSSKQEQRAAGKGALVLTLRFLAEIYGKRNPRKTHIIFEE